MPSDNFTPPAKSDTPDEHVEMLCEIEARIIKRDRCAEASAHAQWLENGRDLLKAKSLLPHGGFGDWCKLKLDYSTRTAQKLMQAAELFDSWAKTELGSELPKPTAVYALSAPSVPREIRDSFRSRVLAGENVLKEVRIAIKQHRKAVPKAEAPEARRSVKPPEAPRTQLSGEMVPISGDAAQMQEHQAEQERQTAARTAALNLIEARLGRDLPNLLALAAESGGSFFSIEIDRELQVRAQAAGEPVAPHGEMQGEEPSATVDEDAIANEAAPIEPSQTSAAGSSYIDHADETAPSDTSVAAEQPPSVIPVPSPKQNGKYGDLNKLVSGFASSRLKSPTM